MNGRWTWLLGLALACPVVLQASTFLDDFVVQQGHASQIRSVACAPSQSWAASLAEDNAIKIWDLSSRMLVRTLAISNVDRIAAAPHGPFLAIVRRPELQGPAICELWNLERGTEEHTLLDTNFIPMSGFGARVDDVAANSTGETWAVAFNPGASLTGDKESLLFISTNGSRLGTVELESETYMQQVAAMAFVDDRTICCAAGGVLQLVSIDNHKPKIITRLPPEYPVVEALAADPAHGLIAIVESASQTERNSLTLERGSPAIPLVRQQLVVWRIGNTKPSMVLTANAVIYNVCFDADGSHLYAASSKGMAAWELPDGKRVVDFKSAYVPMPAAAEWHGMLVAAGLSGDLYFLNKADGRTLSIFQRAESFLTKAAFSDDGKRLLLVRGRSLDDWNLSGTEEPPAWGGVSGAEWLRARDVLRGGAVYDAAIGSNGVPMVLADLQTKTFNSLGEVIESPGGTRMLVTNASNNLLATFDGYLSADGSLSFCSTNGMSSQGRTWWVVDLGKNTTNGQFTLNQPWFEDHTPGKVRTVVGFDDQFGFSRLSCWDTDNNKRLWTIPALDWQYYKCDRAGKFLVFASDVKGELAIVTLQSTNAPSRIAAEELRQYMPIALKVEFTFSPDSRFLDLSAPGLRISFDLTKMVRSDGRADSAAPTIPVSTVTHFEPGRQAVFARSAGLKALPLPDGSVDISKTESSNSLLRLVSGSSSGQEQEYLVVSQSGYYTCSPRGAALACLRDGLTPISFEQFDFTYNSPAAVLEPLGTAAKEDIDYLEEATRRRRRSFESEPSHGNDFGVAQRPRLDFDLTNVPVVTDQREISVPVRITSESETSISIFSAVDDRLTSESGLTIAAKPAQAVETRFNVTLGAGDNVIDAWAKTHDGVSLHRRLVVTRTSAPTNRTLYVIGVGVSQYRDSTRNLASAASDACDFCDFWQRADKFHGWGRPASWTVRDEQYGFDHLRVLTLTNSQVVRESLEGIASFIANAQIDDRVVMEFAGHGLRDPETDRYYFATHDIDFDRPSLRGFSEADFDRLLSKSAAREIMLFIDTCGSGTPEPPGNGDYHPTRRIVLEDLFPDLSVSGAGGVLAACQAREAAGEASSGVFTGALLQGLQSGDADLNRDTIVTFSELCRYVADEVPRLSQNQQHPKVRRSPIVRDLTVLRYPSLEISPASGDGP